MANVCRLCANVKTPRQLVCSIDDQSLNIKQKLIDCCRWKSYDAYEQFNLPQNICKACLKSLEESWAFAEKVTQAQQYLIAQIVDIKAEESFHIESENTFKQNEILEDIKVFNDPPDFFNYDDDFPASMDFIDNVFEPETFENANLNDIQSDEENSDKIKDIDINLLSLLSDEDKNADGTINIGKIEELNLQNWSLFKWQCCICRELFDTNRHLRDHSKQNYHPQSKSFCPFCDTSFKVRRSVIRHIIRCHIPYLKYCCKKCNKFYWNLSELKKHFYGKHSKKGPKHQASHLCEQCGKSFSDRGKLKKHAELHIPVEQRRQFECYVCKTTFAYKKSLVHHIAMHWGEKIKYQCEVCSSQFSRSDALKRHLLIHEGKLPHQCLDCGKSFRTKFNLKVHERTHTGEKPYACSFCAYRSTDGPNLSKHIKQRHRNHL